MKKVVLDKLFNPASIAVIGASEKHEHAGYWILKNLLESEFDGTIYPINPNRNHVLGIASFPSVTEVGTSVDCAVIATNAAVVPDVLRDCVKAGVKSAVIISAGFAETGPEGKARTDEIRKMAESTGMRILGPNCLGFQRPRLHINASFAPIAAHEGSIAFISQSGALCSSILDIARRTSIGFSYFVSVGDMIDIGYHDLIDYFGHDPHTTSILIYMESLSHARQFLSAARAFARTKPIIVLKAGTSIEGAEAAKSHTGNLAGNDAAFDAAFERVGILRVNTIAELFDSAQILARNALPKGNNLAIVTNAGGPAVIATDTLIKRGGELAKLTDTTKEKISALVPQAANKNNPIDVLGDASGTVLGQVTSAVLADMETDAVLVVITPQAMTEPLLIAKELQVLKEKNSKPLLACFMGAEAVAEGVKLLKIAGIPVYDTPEAAVSAFVNMYTYSRNLSLIYETPATIPSRFTPQKADALSLITKSLASSRHALSEPEVKKLLGFYDISSPPFRLVHSSDEAVTAANEIGYPVVLKITSPDILHKTDFGGVAVGIRSAETIASEYEKILLAAKRAHPHAWIDGILVEKMMKKRYELLLGAKRDPVFGPIIVFGMGGVAVEIFKDTKAGLPPLNMMLALRLIEETKISRLLRGYRGIPGVDMQSIQFLLYKFAYLLVDFPQINTIDINPYAIDEHGGVVLDAKVILDPTWRADSQPYSHLVISPYPAEYSKTIHADDGTAVTLRAIKPEDEPLEAEMFKTFSPQTQRFRFFALKKNVTHELLIRYTQIDYDREIAITALIDEETGKRMIGVVRLIADAYNETAEFAIVLGDPWQKKGLGSMMMDYMLQIATERKVKKVYAYVLPDNEQMLDMFAKRGFQMKKMEDSVRVEKELDR